MAVIETSRFALRPIQNGDAERFQQLCNDLSLAINTARIPYPYTMDDARSFVMRALKEWGNGKEYRFAVCLDAEIIACVGVMPKEADHQFELGYWVGRNYRGQGVASEAVSAVIQHAITNLGARNIVAGYFWDNPPSGRVLEKLGFKRTGKIEPTHSLARDKVTDAIRMELFAASLAEQSGCARPLHA